jgi:hypothetical protein
MEGFNTAKPVQRRWKTEERYFRLPANSSDEDVEVIVPPLEEAYYNRMKAGQ